jgi:hypothetical protein
MPLDAQTQRALSNVEARNRETALTTARQIHERAAQMVVELGTGGLPTESLTWLSTILDTRLAALATQVEMTAIIAADGT